MAKLTSEYGVRKNDNIYLYTKGGEFSYEGKNYVGEYHYDGNVAKIGPTPNDNAQPLQRYFANPEHYIYDKSFGFKPRVLSYVDPKPYLYKPNEQVYSVGVDSRYFVEKVQDDQSYAIEIDSAQFSRINAAGGIDGSIHSYTSIEWKLTGARLDIIAHNELEIYKASALVPSINYAIRNYLEYARITLV